MTPRKATSIPKKAGPGGKKKPTNKKFKKRFPVLRSPSALILAANVRRLRKRLDISQAELGEAIGANQAPVGLIELARSNPTLQTLEVLAEALGTTVADLLTKQARRPR
jgi:DNA-binding XRE family transcriptional regulator